MITESFDSSKPIITPDSFIKKKDKVCDTCIVTFSNKILTHVLSTFKTEKGGNLIRIDVDSSLFYFDYKGKKLAIYCSRVGATAAAMDMIVAHQISGATNFIMFGSAGSLDKEATNGKYVIPTQAYRDEGISYHYAEPQDYIDIKNSKNMAMFFTKLNVPYIEGRNWSTDAIYMETENLFLKRKNDGCISVDMEVSGVQAVCNYYGYNLFCFLETGDVLSTSLYQRAGLEKANHALGKLYVALEIALEIS